LIHITFLDILTRTEISKDCPHIYWQMAN